MCITCTCVFEFVMIKSICSLCVCRFVCVGVVESRITDHGDDHVTPAPLQSDLQLSMSLDVTLKGTTHPSWIAALPATADSACHSTSSSTTPYSRLSIDPM